MRDVCYEPSDRNVPKDSNGKLKTRDQTPVEVPELDAVNKRYLEDRDETKALHQIKKSIIPALKAREGDAVKSRAIDQSRFIEANQNLFNDFWSDVYEDDDNDNVEESNQTARFEFMKALELIDPLPLESVDRKTLKKKWDSLGLEDRQSRRYGTRVNQLLAFAKQNYKLKLPKRERNPDSVTHITITQFTKELLPKYELNEAALLVQVLFGSGMRYGEAFAIDNPARLLPNGTYHVSRQMLDTGKIVNRIKNNKPHNTLVLPEFREAFKEWASIPMDVKKELRLSSAFEKITPTLSKQVFSRPVNQLTNHAFRHCYSIHLLTLGMSVSEIAMLIGDDESTVRDYYVGYIIADDHIDSINARLKKIK